MYYFDTDVREPGFKLQVITFLDSLCYGLLYGFLAPYILSLGADHVVVGILAVGNLICSLISADITNNLTQIYGKRNSLLLVFSIATVSHLLMSLSGNYWYIIFARYIFSATNQSQNLCKDLLLQNTPKDERTYYLRKYSILSGAGFVIGPVISGYLYNFGYSYDAVLAAALTLVNTYMLWSVPKQRADMPQQFDERSILVKSKQKAADAISNFLESNYQKNWDILTIKFLYISSITIFFSKFTQILKHNFNATPFMIGYTSSYMSFLTFAGTYYASSIKNYFKHYSILILAQYALIVTGATILFACYSPAYNLYNIMCIPIIFSTNFMNSIWQDIFKSRRNDYLVKTNIPAGISASMTAPLIFGVTCNAIGHHAVIIFSVIPILASLFILHEFTLQYKLHKRDGKNKHQ